MTIEYIYVTDHGEIIGNGVAQNAKNVPPLEGAKVILNISASPGLDTYYSSTQGKVVPLPTRPGTDYRYNYVAKQWERDVEAIVATALAKRNLLLQQSDYTQFTDVQMVNKQEWAIYRQALRDLPATSGWPLAISWPTPPT